jgi:hypothetical protein
MQSSGREQSKNTTFFFWLNGSKGELRSLGVIKKTTHQRCKSGHYFNITSLHRDLHSPKIIQSDSVRLKQIQNRIEEKTDRLRYSSVQVSKMFFHTVNFRRTKVFFTSSSEIGRSTKENKTTTKRNRNRSEEICKLEGSEQLQKDQNG